MIVRCPNCGTEFGFDDKQVGDGLTVRCSVCKYVFKVEAPGAAAQGWQIRTTDDTSFTAPDIATLREWIDEGRLHPDDQVSRTGRSWMRIGDMPEFAQSFARFRPVAPAAAASTPPAVAPTRPAVAPTRPAAAGAPAGLVASGLVAPQSQRPTLSPPRSAPAPSPAPVAGGRSSVAPPRAPVPASAARPVLPPSTAAPIDDEIDEIEIDEDVDDEAPTASEPALARSREPSDPARRRPPSRPQQAAPKPQPEPEPEPEPESDESADDLDAFEAHIGKRGISPGFIALLGVVTAVGVMFGVPSIRTKLLNLGQGFGQGSRDAPAEPAEVVRGPEVAAAEAATRTLGVAALARAEAELQRALDAGGADPATTAARKVALADLLLSRAIAYEIAAALDEPQRDRFRRHAADDREDGRRIVTSLEGAPDVERLAEVRALARLAAGRAEAEVLPLVPEQAAETRLIVRAAVLWQDLDAPVPPGLVSGLSELANRGALGDSALALALMRAGDTVEARNVAERLLVGAEDQVVGLAVRMLVKAGEGETGEGETGEASEGEASEAADEPPAKAPPRPTEDDAAGSGAAGSGGGSFDSLLSRGCKQVSSGDAANGIKTLMRAYDLKANDLDVLVCLGDGHMAQGNTKIAADFYGRGLEQSPSNIPALRGAAKAAVKLGATERATDLYERLLAADPNNAAAKAYLAKQAAKDEPPAASAEDSD